MLELNMAIYTGGGDGGVDNKVTLTARFATHAEAVAFHDGLANLCRDHSPKPDSERKALPWFGGKVMP